MKDKSSLRIEYLQKRKNLPLEEREFLSGQIAGLFFERFPAVTFECIHIYIPIEKMAEVNTWPIIRGCHSLGKKVLIPLYDTKTGDMLTAVLKPNEDMHLNAWGAPEPVCPQLEAEPRPGILIAPLLAYDHIGNRIGYGKGMYDIFLKRLPDKPQIAGLSFFDPVAGIVNVDEWDCPLDFCITPDKVYNFLS